MVQEQINCENHLVIPPVIYGTWALIKPKEVLSHLVHGKIVLIEQWGQCVHGAEPIQKLLYRIKVIYYQSPIPFHHVFFP
jgi:hypothetical protein